MIRASIVVRAIWLVVVLVASHAGAQTATPPPSVPPKVTFKSHYLIDFATNTPLVSNDPDLQLPPASLTKLMTAYLVFDALESGRLRLDESAHISEKAWRMGGTRMFIEVNSDVTIENLIRGLLIQSGNDAAVALAEHLSGSVDAFVAEMNTAAKTLGMQNTAFRNPHGLPARGHYSTARDLAILARAIISEFPEFYGLYAEREFAYNGIQQQNRNALLRRDASVDGMKTGYTESAGYCMVVSAERDGMRLIAVVMGADTARQRNDGGQKLLEYGFANFETRKVYAAGQELEAARVFGGDSELAPLGIARDVYVTIPRGAAEQLAASMDVIAQLSAPLMSGTTVGEVKVSFAGEQLATSPVIVLANVLDGGVWARMRDELSFLWE